MKKLFTYVALALILVVFQSCKKRKAEEGLVGNWIVNSAATKKVSADSHPLTNTSCGEYITFSGELHVDKIGNGYAMIYGTYCDSTYLLFDKNIEDLEIIDHSASWDSNKGYKEHWYQGYFSGIYFDCKSLSDKGVIDKGTSEIEFNIGSLIDQSTGGSLETYLLRLVLTKQ